MPQSLTELQTPLTRESVREICLELLEDLDFPVEAWQDEAAARMIVEVQAAISAEHSVSVATLAKMVFLATATDEFLTAKVKSDYDEERNAAVAAVFPVDFANSGGVNHVKEA